MNVRISVLSEEQMDEAKVEIHSRPDHRHLVAAMPFDEAAYREEFLKKLRGARSAAGRPDGPLRDHPARDRRGDRARRSRRCAAYWNKIYNGSPDIAQVAKLCRAEDERLRAEHGAEMETRAWWQRQQSDQQQTAEKSIAVHGRRAARSTTASSAWSPSGIVGKFAAKLGLTRRQAARPSSGPA